MFEGYYYTQENQKLSLCILLNIHHIEEYFSKSLNKIYNMNVLKKTDKVNLSACGKVHIMLDWYELKFRVRH